ncbi:nicotinamide-nucleotide amidohydrolase family protein, partial [candidate division KSB1 bacterium]
DIIVSRTIKLIGIGESTLAGKLEHVLKDKNDIEVAFIPRDSLVDIRLTAYGKKESDLKKKIRKTEKEIIQTVPEKIYGFDADTIERVVGDLLRRKNLTLAVAESCTGGLLGDRLTSVPGSSDYFIQGVITYSNESKIKLLSVSPETLLKTGAVSEETAAEMAEGIKKKSGSDIGISITGIAGPSGGTPEKPVGLVYIGLSDSHRTTVKKLMQRYGLERQRIKLRSAYTALNLIRLHLLDSNIYK